MSERSGDTNNICWCEGWFGDSAFLMGHVCGQSERRAA